MKVTLLLIFALLLTACGQTSFSQNSATGDSKSSVESKTSSAQAGPAEARFEVKAMLNGTELASYSQSGPRTVVLYDGESLTVFLSSNDNKNVLTLNIHGTKPGVYPLPSHDGAPKQGEARLELMHDDKPPVRIATNGEARLEKYSGDLCSGSFKGTGTDFNGGKFSIEGSFTNMSVRTAAGQ